jgi:hypothetical protein
LGGCSGHGRAAGQRDAGKNESDEGVVFHLAWSPPVTSPSQQQLFGRSDEPRLNGKYPFVNADGIRSTPQRGASAAIKSFKAAAIPIAAPKLN